MRFTENISVEIRFNSTYSLFNTGTESNPTIIFFILLSMVSIVYLSLIIYEAGELSLSLLNKL